MLLITQMLKDKFKSKQKNRFRLAKKNDELAKAVSELQLKNQELFELNQLS